MFLFFFKPNFKDYPVYLAKFKQCLSKAMHFMKVHIVNTMQNLSSALTKRVRHSRSCILLIVFHYITEQFRAYIPGSNEFGKRRQCLYTLLRSISSSCTQSSCKFDHYYYYCYFFKYNCILALFRSVLYFSSSR